MLAITLACLLLAAVGVVCLHAPPREPRRAGWSLDVPAAQAAAPRVAVRYRGRTASEWAARFRRRTVQLQQARRVLFARASVGEAINLAAAAYDVDAATLWRKARCESNLNPGAQNASEASGLFQFIPSTFRSTPFGGFSIWSPYANALAAGWMHAHGRGGEWSCR